MTSNTYTTNSPVNQATNQDSQIKQMKMIDICVETASSSDVNFAHALPNNAQAAPSMRAQNFTNYTVSGKDFTKKSCADQPTFTTI